MNKSPLPPDLRAAAADFAARLSVLAGGLAGLLSWIWLRLCGRAAEAAALIAYLEDTLRTLGTLMEHLAAGDLPEARPPQREAVRRPVAGQGRAQTAVVRPRLPRVGATRAVADFPRRRIASWPTSCVVACPEGITLCPRPARGRRRWRNQVRVSRGIAVLMFRYRNYMTA